MAGGIRSYSTTPGSNNAATPYGWPEGMLPSSVNNTARQLMADIRDGFEQFPYFDWGDTPIRVDNDTFTVVTDLTARYIAGRRVKLVGATTGYATITSSSYSAPDTTVNVTMDSGNVPTSLTNVYLGPDTSIGAILPYFAITAAEIAAGVTPTAYQYAPGNPWRYGADGANGAADIAALATAKTINSTTNLDGWRNGVPNIGNLRTAAEVTAAILATDYGRNTEPYDIRRFGAKVDNSTDDTTAVVNTLTVGTTAVAGALGACISVPTGICVISSMVTLPNRVHVRGQNKRGSYFFAKAGWNSGTSPWMFNAKNGTSSMFDSTLTDVAIDCNNIAGLGCVLSDAWQEDCGLRAALLINFATTGITFQNGYGGASLARISDTEIFGGSTAGAVGVDLQQISLTGAFMLCVNDTSITGGSAALAKGINIVNDSLHCRDVHFESCTTGIYLDGVGHHVLIGVTGSSSSLGVTNLVELASTFTGTLTMIGCARMGSTNFIKDNRAGGIGTITGLDYAHLHISAQATVHPIVAPGSNWSAGYFNGTSGSPTLTAGYNVASITKNGAGDYTITESRARPTVACAPWVTCNLANVDYRVDLVGASTYRLRLYVAGVLTDSNEVKFANVRLL